MTAEKRVVRTVLNSMTARLAVNQMRAFARIATAGLTTQFVAMSAGLVRITVSMMEEL